MVRYLFQNIMLDYRIFMLICYWWAAFVYGRSRDPFLQPEADPIIVEWDFWWFLTWKSSTTFFVVLLIHVHVSFNFPDHFHVFFCLRWMFGLNHFDSKRNTLWVRSGCHRPRWECSFLKYLPSLKLTWHIKITPWKRIFLSETIIFRGLC